jgi:16S rRNA processing protein RimM
MIIDDCFKLGHIVKKHGLKGELSILLDVDFPEDYRQLESVFVEVNKQLVPFFIEYLQLNGERGIIKFEDTDDLASAEKLLKSNLYLPADNLPELGEGQFYYHEVLGYMVVDETLGEVGLVDQIYEFPNQDLFGVIHQEKEVLIPINDQLIVNVDHQLKQVAVDLPAGLLDVYLED